MIWINSVQRSEVEMKNPGFITYPKVGKGMAQGLHGHYTRRFSSSTVRLYATFSGLDLPLW